MYLFEYSLIHTEDLFVKIELVINSFRTLTQEEYII